MQELGTSVEMLAGLVMIGSGILVLWWEQKIFERRTGQPLIVLPVQSSSTTPDNTSEREPISQVSLWLACFLLSGLLTAAGGWFIYGFYGAISLLVMFLFVNGPIGISRMRKPTNPLTVIINRLELLARSSKGRIELIKEEIDRCFRTRKFTEKEQRQVLQYLAYRDDSIGKAAKDLLELQDRKESDDKSSQGTCRAKVVGDQS